MPGSRGLLINNSMVMVTLVSGGGTGTLVNWKNGRGIVLFFYMIYGVVDGGIVCYRGVAYRGTRTSGAGRGLGAFASGLSSFVCGCHGSMKRGKIAHHTLILLLLVSVHGLSVLTKII